MNDERCLAADKTKIDGVLVTKQIIHPKYMIAINALPLDESKCFVQYCRYVFSYANKTSHKRDSQATSILDMHQYARRYLQRCLRSRLFETALTLTFRCLIARVIAKIPT